eukprot:CAMPEP_0181300860 /NCGR_PEP_ID=MMETSP1101-20121128/7115_1 /TAXON_ID=46948 /ORGANISM="Rhodomonas abbreviata, Strain Caron Lab Isolate" /LENGTH=926 /DNA_ID=CAMNT_0023406125 /DNA_START=194 /DNA_END=2971 /DNA_ORIENTATION=-
MADLEAADPGCAVAQLSPVIQCRYFHHCGNNRTNLTPWSQSSPITEKPVSDPDSRWWCGTCRVRTTREAASRKKHVSNQKRKLDIRNKRAAESESPSRCETPVKHDPKRVRATDRTTCHSSSASAPLGQQVDSMPLGQQILDLPLGQPSILIPPLPPHAASEPLGQQVPVPPVGGQKLGSASEGPVGMEFDHPPEPEDVTLEDNTNDNDLTAETPVSNCHGCLNSTDMNSSARIDSLSMEELRERLHSCNEEVRTLRTSVKREKERVQKGLDRIKFLEQLVGPAGLAAATRTAQEVRVLKAVMEADKMIYREGCKKSWCKANTLVLIAEAIVELRLPTKCLVAQFIGDLAHNLNVVNESQFRYADDYKGWACHARIISPRVMRALRGVGVYSKTSDGRLKWGNNWPFPNDKSLRDHANKIDPHPGFRTGFSDNICKDHWRKCRRQLPYSPLMMRIGFDATHSRKGLALTKTKLVGLCYYIGCETEHDKHQAVYRKLVPSKHFTSIMKPWKLTKEDKPEIEQLITEVVVPTLRAELDRVNTTVENMRGDVRVATAAAAAKISRAAKSSANREGHANNSSAGNPAAKHAHNGGRKASLGQWVSCRAGSALGDQYSKWGKQPSNIVWGKVVGYGNRVTVVQWDLLPAHESGVHGNSIITVSDSDDRSISMELDEQQIAPAAELPGENDDDCEDELHEHNDYICPRGVERLASATQPVGATAHDAAGGDENLEDENTGDRGVPTTRPEKQISTLARSYHVAKQHADNVKALLDAFDDKEPQSVEVLLALCAPAVRGYFSLVCELANEILEYRNRLLNQAVDKGAPVARYATPLGMSETLMQKMTQFVADSTDRCYVLCFLQCLERDSDPGWHLIYSADGAHNKSMSKSSDGPQSVMDLLPLVKQALLDEMARAEMRATNAAGKVDITKYK